MIDWVVQLTLPLLFVERYAAMKAVRCLSVRLMLARVGVVIVMFLLEVMVRYCWMIVMKGEEHVVVW